MEEIRVGVVDLDLGDADGAEEREGDLRGGEVVGDLAIVDAEGGGGGERSEEEEEEEGEWRRRHSGRVE